MYDENKDDFVSYTKSKKKNVSEIDSNYEMSSEELKEKVKIARRRVIRFHLRTVLIMLVISIVLVLLGLLWQDKYTLMAWGDALWLAVALEFSAAWMMFIYNQNIMSPVIYGLKTFFLMFAAKKPKMDYYGYTKSIEEEQIPKYIYRVIFISSFILMIPAIIIFTMLV